MLLMISNGLKRTREYGRGLLSCNCRKRPELQRHRKRFFSLVAMDLSTMLRKTEEYVAENNHRLSRRPKSIRLVYALEDDFATNSSRRRMTFSFPAEYAYWIMLSLQNVVESRGML